MNKKLLIVIILLIIILALFSFLKDGKSGIPGLDILNPAAKNCIDRGGAIQEDHKGDGKSYNVCLFEDNRQCEVDSLLSGDCPIGGLKITGYITKAATYCAILGGKYQITGMNGDAEDGNCSFFNGNICNVWDLYNGKCEKGKIDAIEYENEEFSFSIKLPRDWENKFQMKRKEGENGIRYIFFDYGEANLFKISIVPYSFWADKSKKEGDYLGRNNVDVFAFIYSTDPLRSDKQWGEEYLKMVLRTTDIKDTFKITKPYIFLEKTNEDGKNYSIEVMYPYAGAVKSAQVNIEISDFIDKITSSFKEAVSANDSWGGENSLKIYYDPYEINSEFMSVRFEISEYTGGAHPNSYSKSFNYDLKNNKVITLSDLFDNNKDYINVISNKTIQYLVKINNDSGFSDEDWIKEGAGSKTDNYQVFTFNKNTIVFYFDPYQVAAYAAGRQDVIFPISSLKDILRDDAISAYGLK